MNGILYYKLKYRYSDEDRWADLPGPARQRYMSLPNAIDLMQELAANYRGGATFKIVRVREDDVRL